MLIDCPECGARISDRARMCPHCGLERTGREPPPLPVRVDAPGGALSREVQGGDESGAPKRNWEIIPIVIMIFAGWFYISKEIKDLEAKADRPAAVTSPAEPAKKETAAKEAAPPAKKAPVKREPVPDAVEAFVMMRGFVEPRLLAPGTAKFPDLMPDDPGTWARRKEGRVWEVGGYVDAENAFGATLRRHYVGRVRWMGGSQWSLVELNLDE